MIPSTFFSFDTAHVGWIPWDDLCLAGNTQLEVIDAPGASLTAFTVARDE